MLNSGAVAVAMLVQLVTEMALNSKVGCLSIAIAIEIWDLGILGSGEFGILGIWDHGNLGS